MILRGVSAFVAGDLAAAGALADLALDLALREASPTSLGVAHHLQILTRYSRGDLAGVEKHFVAGEKFFDDPGLRQYPGATVSAFGFASLNALVLGRADIARARMARIAAPAKRDSPFDAALAGYYASVLRVLLREYEQAEALAARALELSEKHQFQLLALHSRCVLGQTRAHLGRAAEGVVLIREGIAGLLEIGARLGLNNFTAHIAEAQARNGAIADALETVEQALQARNPNPETLRLRGELRLKLGQPDLGEADLREAMTLANRVGAKFYALRAAISLARLLAGRGRRDEARSILSPLYDWFTEGFDIADLKAAKSLLEELAA
jgi:tetratricopeptide (TPR) repeat protein